MKKTINEIDIVALTQDLPKLGLNKGQTGTVVDISEPGVFLVEFSNEKGEMISRIFKKRTNNIGNFS
jgi:hypothetical protein